MISFAHNSQFRSNLVVISFDGGRYNIKSHEWLVRALCIGGMEGGGGGGGGGLSLIWTIVPLGVTGGECEGFCRLKCWFVSLHFYTESRCAAGISEGYLGQQRQDLLTLNLNDEDWTQCWSESLDTDCGPTISKYFLTIISEQQIHLRGSFFSLQRSYEEINREKTR